MTRTQAHTSRRRTALGAAACALLLTLTGCSARPGKDDNVKTLPEPEAISQVNQYGKKVADLAGAAELKNPTASGAACEGKVGEFSNDVYYVLGTYQLPVPQDKHVATLSRLRDQWRQQGYTVKDDRISGETNTGVLTVQDPEGNTINVESTNPPTALALFINTPCYKSPTPR
jgi:hypothetical protein